jgi:hypothetical protein
VPRTAVIQALLEQIYDQSSAALPQAVFSPTACCGLQYTLAIRQWSFWDGQSAGYLCSLIRSGSCAIWSAASSPLPLLLYLGNGIDPNTTVYYPRTPRELHNPKIFAIGVHIYQLVILLADIGNCSNEGEKR